MPSALQETLSKTCCCLDIELGAFILGITRLISHLVKIMIGIVFLYGGIIEGIEAEAMSNAENNGTVRSDDNSRTLGYSSERNMKEMSALLETLAILWIGYYSLYFLITFLYNVGLKIGNWIMMTPMLIMSAIDIFASPFVQSEGVILAYMMNDSYKKPAIIITIVYEASSAIFGLYVFAVVWGSWMVIKNKSKTRATSGQT